MHFGSAASSSALRAPSPFLSIFLIMAAWILVRPASSSAESIAPSPFASTPSLLKDSGNSLEQKAWVWGLRFRG